eukprot:scaffold7607_cov2124-Prasinococcus_capsulatus_cf.AAC.1
MSRRKPPKPSREATRSPGRPRPSRLHRLLGTQRMRSVPAASSAESAMPSAATTAVLGALVVAAGALMAGSAAVGAPRHPRTYAVID